MSATTLAQALVTISGLMATSAAGAADIQVAPGGANGSGVIAVSGNITPDDGAAFERKTDGLSGSYLVGLESPGGNVLSAMRIGERIRMRGWNAYVLRHCFSACALAWLGGAHRAMAVDAKVGFHAASVDGKETGVGNAIIGSYLTRLGYGYRAILFATSARPDGLSLLTPDRAREVGISVLVVDPKKGGAAVPMMPPAPAPEPAPAPAAAPERAPAPPPR